MDTYVNVWGRFFGWYYEIKKEAL